MDFDSTKISLNDEYEEAGDFSDGFAPDELDDGFIDETSDDSIPNIGRKEEDGEEAFSSIEEDI